MRVNRFGSDAWVSPLDGGPQFNQWSSVAVMDDASLRASDADREQALVALREHLVAGRLTLEEFCERVEAALRARVTGELAHLQDDLPEALTELGRFPPQARPSHRGAAESCRAARAVQAAQVGRCR